jgi:hypothetical protein
MSKTKNHYHELFEWQHICEVSPGSSMPYHLLGKYDISVYQAQAMGINVQAPTDLNDYTEEEISYSYFLQNKLDNEKLDEEFEKLESGDRMLVGITEDEHGNVYEKYMIKE